MPPLWARSPAPSAEGPLHCLQTWRSFSADKRGQKRSKKVKSAGPVPARTPPPGPGSHLFLLCERHERQGREGLLLQYGQELLVLEVCGDLRRQRGGSPGCYRALIFLIREIKAARSARSPCCPLHKVLTSLPFRSDSLRVYTLATRVKEAARRRHSRSPRRRCRRRHRQTGHGACRETMGCKGSST